MITSHVSRQMHDAYTNGKYFTKTILLTMCSPSIDDMVVIDLQYRYLAQMCVDMFCEDNLFY